MIGRGLPDTALPDDGFPISPLPDTRLAAGIGHRGTPTSESVIGEGQYREGYDRGGGQYRERQYRGRLKARG